MAREEACVLTNMCMIYDENRILVQDRMNPNWPGITFPGGHVKPRESFVSSVIREVKEETGLDISDVLMDLKICLKFLRMIFFLKRIIGEKVMN